MTDFRINQRVGEDILSRLKDMQDQAKEMSIGKPESQKTGGANFMDHLKETVSSVDEMQKTADKMAADLSTGKAENIHEVMLQTTEAQLAFSLLVQLRNKCLEAYQEVMRMQREAALIFS